MNTENIDIPVPPLLWLGLVTLVLTYSAMFYQELHMSLLQGTTVSESRARRYYKVQVGVIYPLALFCGELLCAPGVKVVLETAIIGDVYRVVLLIGGAVQILGMFRALFLWHNLEWFQVLWSLSIITPATVVFFAHYIK